MKGEPVYFMDAEAWANRIGSLSLELEGAYLRLCNEAHGQNSALINGRWTFQAMFRCGPVRAAALLRRLRVAGMIEATGDWQVRVLHVRFERRSLAAALRKLVIERDGLVCRYCGDEEGPFDIDHILAVARGGSDDPSNLGVACASCNRSKGIKTVEEWLQ